MPKSDKRRENLKSSINQPLAHGPEVLKYLESEANTCDFRSHALELARHGLSIHPLKPRDKSPLLKGWQGFASSEPGDIEQWAEDYPGANIGIATGAPSGVFMIDCDLRNGGGGSLDLLKRQHGELPLTWSVVSPGGWHFYFKHPGGHLRSYNSLAPGIEIKADKGNLVAPGSIHPSGLSYRWQPGCSPGEVPLAEAPGWLLGVLKRKGKWTAPGEVRPEVSQVNILGLRQGFLEGTGVAGSLSGVDILSLFSQELIVKKCMVVMGLGEVEIGEKFRCILHPEAHASAAVFKPEVSGNSYMYRDFHERDEGIKALALPTVYYYFKRGKPGEPIKKLPKPTFVVWALRLLRDAGVIEGVKVDAPRLPDGIKPSVRRIYEGFLDLISLRFLIEKVPSPYVWTFASSWVGAARKTVSGAMRWLLGAGYLQCMGHYGSDEAGNKLMLFLPGTRGLVERRRGRAWLEKGGQTVIIEDVKADVAVLERENSDAEQAKHAVKLCPKCGAADEWVKFDEILTCMNCWQAIDSS